MCQADVGRCPDVEAPAVGCRQPKLCISYNKDTWKTEDMADGMLVPDKTGTKPINLGRHFVFVQITKPSKSDSINTRNCYLQRKKSSELFSGASTENLLSPACFDPLSTLDSWNLKNHQKEAE